MADRIITVTDPSIVTNDTLLGYNNYSDIDGQLGTTMTPTEATNGKTITLSDGVVHEVTTKPVGTTNGEFSAVVSDAVTVDLSSATPVTFTLTGMTEASEIYTNTGVAYSGNYGVSTTSYAGDFDFEIGLDTDAVKQCMFGVSSGGVDNAWNGATAWNFGMYLDATERIQRFTDGTATSMPDTVAFNPLNKMRFIRVSDNLKLWYDEDGSLTEIYDFGAFSGTAYLHISTFTSKQLNYPRVTL